MQKQSRKKRRTYTIAHLKILYETFISRDFFMIPIAQGCSSSAAARFEFSASIDLQADAAAADQSRVQSLIPTDCDLNRLNVSKVENLSTEEVDRQVSEGASTEPNLLYKQAVLLLKGMVESDNALEKGMGLLREAIEAGSLDAVHYLGTIYYKGEFGLEPDYNQAMQLFEKAAAKGHCVSLVELGNIYWNGHLREKDISRAVRLFEKAADLGNVDAMNYLGLIYAFGIEGIEKNYRRSAELLTKPVNHGYPIAVGCLGSMHLFGLGVVKDPKKAFMLLKKSADEGVIHAMSDLAYMYERGIEAEQNYEKAASLYERALESDPRPMYSLASLYYVGWGVKKDRHKAKELYEKALLADPQIGNKTHAEPTYHLALMYYEGSVVPKNFNLANELFMKAFQSDAKVEDYGHPEATRAIAWMYEQGIGVQKNPKRAFDLYRKAYQKSQKAFQKGSLDSLLFLSTMLYNHKGVAITRFKTKG